MKKTTAKNFIEALAWIEAPFGKMDLLLLELDGPEKEFHKQKLGLLLKSHFEIMVSISKAYPDLDPMNEGMDSYKKLKAKYEK